MKKRPKIRFYRDTSVKREWRWTLKSANGTIVDASSEGFKTLSGAKKNFSTVKTAAASAIEEIVDAAVEEIAKKAKKKAKKAARRRRAA